MDNIITWDKIQEDIKTLENAVLLGNGFSISYKMEDFKQQSILDEMSSLSGKSEIFDIEECIKETQNLVSTEIKNNAVSKQIIDNWIKEKLRKEFISKLFEKMPATIRDKDGYNEQTLIPYKEFLSNFKNIYTLNYDPLLYWMSLHFNPKGDKDVVAFLKEDESFKSLNPQDKKFEDKKLKVTEKYINTIKTIRTKLFSNTIKKDKYDMKVFYGNTCLFDKKLSEVETDKIITKTVIEKISDTIYNNMSESIDDDEDIRKEYEKITENTKNEFELRKAEIIANNNGVHVEYNDGFLPNSDKTLEWNDTNPQNTFYIHGAFHLLEKDNLTIKIKADDSNRMLENIKMDWDNGFESLTILESGHKNKLEEINRYPYLKHSFETFRNCHGNIITLGVSFLDSDNHIVDALNKNSNLENIYIGYHEDVPPVGLINKFKDNIKVKFFSTRNIFN